MKKTFGFILTLWLICMVALPLQANIPVSVTPLPLVGQLPSNSVRFVYQTHEGILWLATADGLCRYDGYRVRVFRSSPQNPGLLSNNDIKTLAETKDGHLLIGTAKGLNVLDVNTGRIASLTDENLREYEIRSIVVDKEGYIWVGTYKRLVRCSPDLQVCEAYDSSLPVTSVNTVFRDTDDNIWVAFWGKGLYKYDREQNRFHKMPRLGKDDNPSRVFQDKNKNYYLATWGEGIWRMFPYDTSGVRYEPMKIAGRGENPQRDVANVFGMVQDDEYGYFWLIGDLGLTVMKCNGNTLTRIDMPSLEGEMNNIFSDIMKDQNNNLWISAFNEGAYTISLNAPLIQNYPLSMIGDKTGHRLTTNINALCKEPDGTLWISQNRWGLGIYFPTIQQLEFYTDCPNLKNIQAFHDVSCIQNFQSAPDEVWVAPQYAEDIYVLSRSGKDIKVKEQYDLRKLDAGIVQAFYEDCYSNIWVLTSWGLLVKPFGGELQKVKLDIEHLSVLSGDEKGNLWLGSSASGIYKARPKFTDGECVIDELQSMYKVAGGLPGVNIEAICVDTIKHKVWAGSKDGYIYTCHTENYTIEDLSPAFEHYLQGGIQKILADTLGHIWISTGKVVVEYNPHNKGKIAYTDEDGLIVNSFMKNACFYDGVAVWLGGNRGIANLGNNALLNKDAKAVRTLITDVKVDGKSILDGMLSSVYAIDFDKRELRLDDDARNIEIDFSAFQYHYADKIRYAYRIKGVDEKWIYPDNNRRFAYYNRLPKGKHTLELKATDINGVWSGRVVTYTIERLPAWYETWVAYILYTILFVILLRLLYLRMKRRWELQNELRLAQIEKKQAEELTQTKLRYFTNVSHDFLTPIAIVSCLIDDVEMTYRNNIPQLDQMRSNLRKLKRLIQQVLDFRKMESGNLKLKVALGDLAKFVQGVCNDHFTPLMQQKNIDFICRLESEQIPAYFDADKVEKVVFNLLSNAHKYTNEGGKVELSLHVRQEVGGNVACIEVKDTGCGISAENQKHIFGRFFTDRGNVNVESNGIGLSMVKDLLDLHHATIEVQSEVGQGTVFTILLPIDKDCYSEAELVPTDEVTGIKRMDAAMKGEVVLEQEETGTPTEEHTMLIVEDNVELLDLMFHIFSRRFQVLIAHHGVEALEVMKSHEIDIVISDVMMPEMDGLTLCRQLKTNIETSHIPVILLTAKNSPDDRVECYNAGADGYIAKPFELKVLEARISNFLANKQVRQKEFVEDTTSDTEKLDVSPIDQQFIDRLIAVIEEKMSDDELDVNMLADAACMSKSSFYRKVKAITGISPVEFVRNIRMKHAVSLLQDEEMSIADVAYAAGFSNPKYFSTCFKEQFGVSPKEYRKK